MNPKQLLVPGAVIVGGYFLLRPGGLLEQIMGQLGGSAEGGAPMPDPYAYGGATTKPTDEIVRWTDPSPTPTGETPGGTDTGGDNWIAPPSERYDATATQPPTAGKDPTWVQNAGDYAWLAAGAATLGATALGGGRAGKIGEAVKNTGSRAWSTAERLATKYPRLFKLGAGLAVGYEVNQILRKPDTEIFSIEDKFRGWGQSVSNWFTGGATTAPTTQASISDFKAQAPKSGGSGSFSFNTGGQGAQTNPNRPSGSSTPFTVTTQGIAPGQLSPTIAAAIKSRGGTVSTSSSSSSSGSSKTYGGFGLRQVGTTSSGGRVFK